MKITKALQDTLLSNPKIDKVYFDEQGRHYFQVFSLQSGKKDTEKPKLYGTGIFSHQQVIPGVFNTDGIMEPISKGKPDTLIVSEMSRKDVLKAEVKEDDNALVHQVLNMSEKDLENLRALLDKKTETKETETKKSTITPLVKKD